MSIASSAKCGLSPPTRGIPTPPAPTVIGSGSIPAYAGDPTAHSLLKQLAEVYPRLRGGSFWLSALEEP